MTEIKIKKYILKYFRFILTPFYMINPMKRADHVFMNFFGRSINWNDPKDLNEKINWLKFHIDPYIWANLSDKYKVREYVQEKGLSELLVPFYGKWECSDDLIRDWESLPDEFVLKSNNGCSHVYMVDSRVCSKKDVDLKELKKTIDHWLSEKNYGVQNAELHYQLIKNSIIAEKLLSDENTNDFSRSMIDYKIWCFNGKPYGCLIVYDRHDGSYKLDFYDVNWEHKSDFICGKHKKPVSLPKPKNWDLMIDAAKRLSDSHPQVRVDFYNIDGRIYFGEMTFTSFGGYMDYFTPDALRIMGDEIQLDLSLPGNMFMKG